MKNLRSGKLTKMGYKIRVGGVRLQKYVSEEKYIKSYRKLLQDYGMKIPVDNCYIDPTAYFDNYDYSLITIGDGVTISKEVLILTHDFSISKGLAMIGEKGGRFQKEVCIGDNCFIGARALLLPGTQIGNNCVIGAGAVVKGHIPNDSILVGNPAKIIGNTKEWGIKHFELKDYIENP